MYLDQYFSSTLGQPLSVSCFGDCLPPVPLNVDDVEHRLSSFVCQFTMTATEILRTEDLTSNKIDTYSEKLLHLLETLPPSLRFNKGWLDPGTQIPSWPLDIQAVHFYTQAHTYLILMNRQRRENHESESFEDRNDCDSLEVGSTPGCIQPLPNPTSSSREPFQARQLSHCHRRDKGYDNILRSSRAIIHAFEFLCGHNTLNKLDWAICQAAFHAAYILGMAMYETNDFETDVRQILGTRSSFDELAKSIGEVGGDSPLRGILTWSRIASEKLAVFLRGSWNELNSTEDNHGEPDRVMDQRGMILLEDPGLIHPTSQHDFLSIVNWQTSYRKSWDNEAKKKTKMKRENTLTLMPDIPAGDATIDSEDLTVNTEPFVGSAASQHLLPTDQWGTSHRNELQGSTSRRTMLDAGTANATPQSSHYHHGLAAPVTDDIDVLLSKGSLPPSISLLNGVSDSNFPSTVPKAQANNPIFAADPRQSYPQPPMFYPKVHPPQVLHSPIDHNPYGTYSPSWETFPSHSQRGQSTPSSASLAQHTTSNQSQFSTSPSIAGTPGNSFLPFELSTTCQQQVIPAICDMQYSQVDVVAGSSVYSQHSHTATGFDWSQDTIQ